MSEKLCQLMILMQLKMAGLLEDIRSEERGASDIVAVIMLVVIVIAVAVLFNDTITQAAQQIMDRLKEFVGI
ncbi:MAG: Flp1 family type IVb pilin [Blautia sp.]